MKALAKARSIRISPRKVSPVAMLIQGKGVDEAQTILKFTPKRAAGIIAKALNSALANAEQNHGLKRAQLSVEKVLVGPATTLKRYRPRARGAAYPLLKYSSHITVVLTDDSKEAESRKQETGKVLKAKTDSDLQVPDPSKEKK